MCVCESVVSSYRRYQVVKLVHLMTYLFRQAFMHQRALQSSALSRKPVSSASLIYIYIYYYIYILIYIYTILYIYIHMFSHGWFLPHPHFSPFRHDFGAWMSEDGPWLGLFNLSVRSSSLDTLLKTQQVSGLSSLAWPKIYPLII